MSAQNMISLLLITIGVALCAAYGGQLPQQSKQRETLKVYQRILQGQSASEPERLAKVTAELEASPPQSPKARLNEWLSISALPFGAGCLLIVVGGLIARRSESAEGEQASDTPAEAVDFGLLLSDILAEVQAIYELSRDLSPEDPNGSKALRQRIQALQRGDLERLIDARGKVRAKHGVTAFAELFGPISQGERRLNRAWSALTDSHIEESTRSLQGACAALEEAAELLQRL